MSSHSGRGVTAGTPIPRLGERPQVNSAVNEYKLSPEELERYRNLGKSRFQEKPGIYTFSQVHAEEERDGKMGTFALTREQYLQERKTKTRAQIIKEQGITPPALIYHLRQWGLKDSVVEERELVRLDNPAPVEAELSISAHAESAATVEETEPVTGHSDYAQPVDNIVDNSVDNTTSSVQESENGTQYITIRVPVMYVDWPDEFRESQRVPVDRDTLIKFGVACLANASAWAYKELIDLIGEGDLQTPLQTFMARKCGEFVMSSEVEM